MVQADTLLRDSDSDMVQDPKPRSAKRVVGQVFGGVVLLLGGVAIGRQHAPSLRGSSLSLIGEVISTQAEYETAYRAHTQGMGPAALSAANSAIYDVGNQPTGPTDLVALSNWFKAVSTTPGVDSKWAEHMMNTAFVNAALPGATPVPAKQATTPSQHGCSTSISSKTEFGNCYSHATAGRPWAHIVKMDHELRGAVLPAGSSTEMTVLWSWYQQHASVSEKHDFENSALAHMKSAGSA